MTLARIVVDASHNVSEVHVVSDGERPAKQIVRDIETTLYTTHGIKVDHRKISVALLNESKIPGNGHDAVQAVAAASALPHSAPRAPRPPDASPFAEPAPERVVPAAMPALAPSDPDSEAFDASARLRFVALNLQVSGSGCQATVELKRGEVPTLGDAAGPGPGRAALRSLAEATLGAVTHCYQDGSAFILEEIAFTTLGQSEIVLVSVSYQRGREVIQLLGSTYVGVDPQQAVIFATLDAINRFTGRLKERRFSEYEVGPTAGRFQSLSGAK
ncbi:MAG: hypothetical protein ACKVU1_09615 [bacterium]